MGRNPDWYLPTFLPHNSLAIAVLLVFSSCITSTTFGYDGSMMNGLNILPSYNNYFNLNPETTGALTASVWIGGILSGLTYGTVTDLIGRRPALFWAAVITLIGVILQTASQNIAMFIIARIFIGYGTSSSALTGPAYLAETLPYKWRAWGLGVLNDFCMFGQLSHFVLVFTPTTRLCRWPHSGRSNVRIELLRQPCRNHHVGVAYAKSRPRHIQVR